MEISKAKIERIMAIKGLTVSQVAQAAGMFPQNISIAKRRESCTPATAGKLAKALGVDVREIMKEEA